MGGPNFALTAFSEVRSAVAGDAPRATALQDAPGSNYLEVGHHSHVLVLELVAVHEVEPPIPLEADEDLDGLAVLEEDSVLPPLLPGEEPPAPAAAREDLEGGAVDVHRVWGVPSGGEAPELGLAEGHPEVDAVQLVFLAVDAAHAVEAELAGGYRIGQLRD